MFIRELDLNLNKLKEAAFIYQKYRTDDDIVEESESNKVDDNIDRAGAIDVEFEESENEQLIEQKK